MMQCLFYLFIFFASLCSKEPVPKELTPLGLTFSLYWLLMRPRWSCLAVCVSHSHCFMDLKVGVSCFQMITVGYLWSLRCVSEFAVLSSFLSPSTLSRRQTPAFLWNSSSIRHFFARCHNPMKERRHCYHCLQWGNWEWEKVSDLSMVMGPSPTKSPDFRLWIIPMELFFVIIGLWFVLSSHGWKVNGWLIHDVPSHTCQWWCFQSLGIFGFRNRVSLVTDTIIFALVIFVKELSGHFPTLQTQCG